jgi:peptidoglycan/xylan/chitin deacetylase (PgdA/CDA1 family)
MKKHFVALLLAMFAVPAMAQTTKGWLFYENYKKYLAAKSRQVVDGFFFRGATTDKVVALTFDDGWIPQSPAIVNYFGLAKNPGDLLFDR